MIADLIDRAIIHGETLSDEDRIKLLDWFMRAENLASPDNPTTGQVSGIPQTEIAAMVEDAISSSMGAYFPRLSDVSPFLGTVIAGEFRTGNFQTPGDGFTGGRFGYPGFSYNGVEWFLAGVENDVLKVGLSIADGRLYAEEAQISGTITATAGFIGGWQISSEVISDAAGVVGLSSAVTGSNDVRIFAGSGNPALAPFQVYESGAFVASDATITGTITATSGTIGGWSISGVGNYIRKLSGLTGIVLDAATPKIQVGNTGGTHILLDGANQRIRSSNFTTGAAGFNIAADTGDAEFNNITARGELKTFLLTSSNQMAVAGNIIVSKDAGKLGADVSSGATTVNFGKALTVGDWIKIQGPDSAGSNALEWMLVGSLVSGTTYNVTRDVDGSGANGWLKDTPFVVIGQSGDSRIELVAGASGSLQLITQGAAWNTQTVQASMSTVAGAITAGGGDIALDEQGAWVKNQQAAFGFEDTNGDRFNLYIYSDGDDNIGILNDIPGSGVVLFMRVTDTGQEAVRWGENGTNANVSELSMSAGSAGALFSISNQVEIWAAKDGTETVLNQGGYDIDHRIETDHQTEALKIDGGLDKATSFRWDGWAKCDETWTRTGNHTFTVSGDVTATYRKGTKVRYGDGATDYGVIASASHAAGTTTINLIPNNDYAMANVSITDKYISYVENPEGFPDEFSFTPSGLVTIGNGTQSAYWKTKANEITIHGAIDYASSGTATTFSSSDLTLPVAMLGTYNNNTPLGIAVYLDITNNAYLGNVRRQSSTTVRFQAVNAASTYSILSAISSTVPFTWGTSDGLGWQFSYLF